MANIAVNTAGNPWIITTTGGALTLPYTLIGNQKTGNMPYSLMPLRIRWVSKAATAGDEVIVQDWKARTVLELVANAVNYQYDITRPKALEAYIGAVITQFDSGTLYIYL